MKNADSNKGFTQHHYQNGESVFLLPSQSRNGAGFTLIELLIYLSLTAVVTIIFTAFTVNVIKTGIRAVEDREVQQSTRFILTRITQEIKTAKEVISVAPEQLILKNQDNINVSFYLDSNTHVVYYNDGSNDFPISNDAIKITQLTFESTANNIINISLTAESKNPNNPSQVNFSSAVALRQLQY
ncbi:MAG: hypothetical protein A2731_03230 [Candidatus Buchananbacteria bacterium RIFCSPHIGHO2_01_FULL_39_8]|uniref:Prepilin-type N-terminal cleavage/methylation domain-containing protein n=1 Tax=Candidatus Buchananbacteria bacterium RIFCSPHIGHO2_01_FULL_39_8 TaxID=1797533 RepID=A0A1G1Y1R8_9BACT|nr:MAG: hypothetical protein A2731_03230 [Candidatus Buchananbacteria bacterium RIFCSPHIGHO2_01_FULL_39_8]